MSEYLIVQQDELYHHGILGMKWGIRRYQNKDGSLTPAGKKRYSKGVTRSDINTLRVKAKETNQAFSDYQKVYDSESKKILDRFRSDYISRVNSTAKEFLEVERMDNKDAKMLSKKEFSVARRAAFDEMLFDNRYSQKVKPAYVRYNKAHEDYTDKLLDISEKTYDKFLSDFSDNSNLAAIVDDFIARRLNSKVGLDSSVYPYNPNPTTVDKNVWDNIEKMVDDAYTYEDYLKRKR